MTDHDLATVQAVLSEARMSFTIDYTIGVFLRDAADPLIEARLGAMVNELLEYADSARVRDQLLLIARQFDELSRRIRHTLDDIEASR